MVIHFIERNIFVLEVGDDLFFEKVALSFGEDDGEIIIFQSEFAIWEKYKALTVEAGKVLGREVEVHFVKIGHGHKCFSGVDFGGVLLLFAAFGPHGFLFEWEVSV